MLLNESPASSNWAFALDLSLPQQAADGGSWGHKKLGWVHCLPTCASACEGGEVARPLHALLLSDL